MGPCFGLHSYFTFRILIGSADFLKARFALPERWVTLSPQGGRKWLCHGRSVRSWKSDFGSLSSRIRTCNPLRPFGPNNQNPRRPIPKILTGHLPANGRKGSSQLFTLLHSFGIWGLGTWCLRLATRQAVARPAGFEPAAYGLEVRNPRVS